MTLYGSYDLALANAPEPMAESTSCLCRHTLEDHASAYPYRCDETDADGAPCICSGFQEAGE